MFYEKPEYALGAALRRIGSEHDAVDVLRNARDKRIALPIRAIASVGNFNGRRGYTVDLDSIPQLKALLPAIMAP